MSGALLLAYSLRGRERDIISWATQKGQVVSRKLEGQGLTGWALEKSGSLACKTDFESKVRIVTPAGSSPSYQTGSNDGDQVAFWSDVPPGSKVEWEVITYADEQKRASDRVQLEMTYLDVAYITRLVDIILTELTEEQMQAVAAGDTDLIENKVTEKLNVADAIVTVWSDVVTTDSEGKATGTIDFNPRWPDSEYSLIIHYGYGGMGERSTTEKRNKFLLEEVVPAVVGVTLAIAATIATGGLATAFAVGAYATAAVDIGILAKQYLIEGFGAIDTNKYGCSFPITGFNHAYSFDVGFEEAVASAGSGMSSIINNPEVLEAYKVKALKHFWPAAIGGSLVVGILLWTILGGGSSE